MSMTLERPAQLQAGIESECQACDDSGWWPHECDGIHAMCGRKHQHPAHGYSIVCPCRPTNRTYQERRAKYWSAA